MCGIAGIIDFNNRIPSDCLGRMLNRIKHRGPDDWGELVSDKFAVGMRRLSVIDLETGHQPVFNEDKSVFTLFNGEIYNFIELRRILEEKGHRFYTHSDTEVLVHAYEEEGISFIKKLNGMFSFLLCDLNRNVFYFVRDQYGIKPFYYHYQGSRLIFGSELGAIKASGLVNISVSEESVINYLNYLYVPSPKSIYNDVLKLEAGHYLTFSIDGLEKRRWYDLNNFVQGSDLSEKSLVEQIRFLLEDSVRLQMRSDVAVGAYLSGGIDSSLITALATKCTTRPFSTFSVGFESSEFDELPYARQVSSVYNTNHHELVISSGDALSKLPEIMKFMDEPIGDSAILPAYLLSQLASEHVKVALSGLGGDELFGGYSRYCPRRNKFDYIGFLPRPFLMRVILPLFRSIQPAWGRQVERLIDPKSPAAHYHGMVNQMSVEMIDQLSGRRDRGKAMGTAVTDIFNRYQGSDRINQMMFTDIELYMNDQLLQLTDRMSMASSLEARVPLLDHRIVELAVSIPSKLKVNSRDTKIILKNAVKDLLPQAILNRPKWGFAAPHKSWIQNRAINQFIEQTIEGNLVSDGILERRGVEGFLMDTTSMQKYSTWVWPLVALEIWYTQSKNL